MLCLDLALTDIELDSLPPPDFVPTPSIDSALTAFAQLGAVRLGAARSLISLVDDNYQYILAEATPTSSFRSNSHQRPDSLWLGRSVIPKKRGLCGSVLRSQIDNPGLEEPGNSVVVINDLTQDQEFGAIRFTVNQPHSKFYAGVPLKSPRGSFVGIFCVFGDQTRDGLDQELRVFMEDMAVTIVEHLEHRRRKDEHKRSEQMIRGLTSFMAGDLSLRAFGESNELVHSMGTSYSNSRRSTSPGEQHTFHATKASERSGAFSRGQQASPDLVAGPLHDPDQISEDLRLPSRLDSPSRSSVRTDQSGQDDHTLQNLMLPSGTRSLFSRAATIIRETGELDGVVILDASTTSYDAGIHRGEKSSVPSSREENASPNTKQASTLVTASDTRSKSQRSKLCNVLGMDDLAYQGCTGDFEDRHTTFSDSELQTLLQHYPSGRIFNRSSSGLLYCSSSTDTVAAEEDEEATTIISVEHKKAGRKYKVNKADTGHSIEKISLQAFQKLAPDARSIAFIPLWDFYRERWFAGCICWTTRSSHFINPGDLHYFKAFGNSIMTELGRLDAIATTEAKTSFVASISHELRSPLHGILGNVEFLLDIAHDAYEESMINSIGVCGRTLLDIIDHILDHSRINQSQNKSTDSLRKSIRSPSPSRDKQRAPSKHSKSPDSVVDLAYITEEVVEGVFAGQNFELAKLGEFNDPEAATAASEHTPHRKSLAIILDIPDPTSWRYEASPGTWRRIVMNLFANSLKYTDSGYVHVCLKADENKEDSSSTTDVMLSISDSGSGISPSYIMEKLYTPFSQENSFSPGIGLGLSIVRQLVDSMNGTLNLQSEVGSGTHIDVKSSLQNAERPFQEVLGEQSDHPSAVAVRLKGRKVRILEPGTMKASSEDEPGSIELARLKMVSSLHQTLANWLGAQVEKSATWEPDSADFLVCIEPTIGRLASVRSSCGQREMPPMILIATDALEATTFRRDPAMSDGSSVVEIISQPCGAYKLARTFHLCMKRLDMMEAGRTSTPTPDTRLTVTSPAMSDEAANTGASATDVSSQRQTDGSGPSPPLDAKISDDAGSNEWTVLIVDDNAVNLRLLIAFAKKNQWKYCQATNGREAVDAYKSAGGRCKYVLTDISMPVMDGMKSTTIMREFERENGLQPATIIALTGLASATARAEALVSGINRFMTKPINFNELRRILTNDER